MRCSIICISLVPAEELKGSSKSLTKLRSLLNDSEELIASAKTRIIANKPLLKLMVFIIYKIGKLKFVSIFIVISTVCQLVNVYYDLIR